MSGFGVTAEGEKIHICVFGDVRRPGWPETCPYCGPVSTWMMLWEPLWRMPRIARWSIERRTYEPGWRHREGPYLAEVLTAGWWRPPPGWRFHEVLLETPIPAPEVTT